MEHALIIEPDHDISRGLSCSLGSIGLSAEVDSSGRTAIGKLIVKEYRMAVAISRLPDLDGISPVSSIRGLGAALPVIVIDEADRVDHCIRALRSGADDYLSLPVD